MVKAMKAKELITQRFTQAPPPMTLETRILGLSVSEWESAWTSGFVHTFRELDERMEHAQAAYLKSPNA